MNKTELHDAISAALREVIPQSITNVSDAVVVDIEQKVMYRIMQNHRFSGTKTLILNSKIDKAINACCADHGYSLEVLKGRSRTKAIGQARQDLMFRLVVDCGLSTGRVGRMLERDHTTVMHGVKAHRERVEDGKLLIAWNAEEKERIARERATREKYFGAKRLECEVA